ncbi:iron uptake cluster protein [Mycena haematopus]|nr:iron uptake cluster protein [Mycena haematopus]
MPSDGPSRSPKTVVVLGGAYGGARAAQLIAAGLPDGWRLVLIDRNSHVNHVYILPRLAVLPGHEHKAFIPYTNVFNRPQSHNYIFLQAHIHSLSTHSLTLSRAFPEHGIPTCTLHFDFAVYALGSHLPSPLNLWHATPDGKPAPPGAYGGTKAESIAWLKGKQRAIEGAASVLVVGGGALGIQFATDIAAVYPAKRVTLLHSRARLLPRFDSAMHSEILQALEAANVDVILGERLDLASVAPNVRTTSGRVIDADLVLLCTGQRPNTDLLRALDPRTVDPHTGLARVLRTMQLALVPTSSASSCIRRINTDSTPYPHVFVIGDAADAFGAIPAGHNAYYQAEVAARNLLRLGVDVAGTKGGGEEELERYTPGEPAIKVSLGLKKTVYQVNGLVGVGKETRDDLNAGAMWAYFGCPVDADGAEGDGEGMYR